LAPSRRLSLARVLNSDRTEGLKPASHCSGLSLERAPGTLYCALSWRNDPAWRNRSKPSCDFATGNTLYSRSQRFWHTIMSAPIQFRYRKTSVAF